MFDAVGAFKKQFTRVEGGYLVYPSPKTGGKLVSEEEYEHLVGRWERVAGRSGRWKALGVIIAVIAFWTSLSNVVFLPEWADSVVIAIVVLSMSGWLLWASTATRRLVRNRPPITPPQVAAEARRDARATLNWPFVVFALIISGAVFFGSVIATERSSAGWAWLIGSGVMLELYLWIAFRKLTDQSD